MSYRGHIFDILWLENGMALLKSETRRDVFHAVDVHEGTCSCEFKHFEKAKCKHLIFLEAIQQAIKELRASEQKQLADNPTALK